MVWLTVIPSFGHFNEMKMFCQLIMDLQNVKVECLRVLSIKQYKYEYFLHLWDHS